MRTGLAVAQPGCVGERVTIAVPACRSTSTDPDTIVSSSIARLKCPGSSNARSSPSGDPAGALIRLTRNPSPVAKAEMSRSLLNYVGSTLPE